MAAKLPKELADALQASGDYSLEVVDPANDRVYVIVDGETHQLAMDALRRVRDRDGIAEGLSQLEAGEGKPIDEALAARDISLVQRDARTDSGSNHSNLHEFR